MHEERVSCKSVTKDFWYRQDPHETNRIKKASAGAPDMWPGNIIESRTTLTAKPRERKKNQEKKRSRKKKKRR